MCLFRITDDLLFSPYAYSVILFIFVDKIIRNFFGRLAQLLLFLYFENLNHEYNTVYTPSCTLAVQSS